MTRRHAISQSCTSRITWLFAFLALAMVLMGSQPAMARGRGRGRGRSAAAAAAAMRARTIAQVQQQVAAARQVLAAASASGASSQQLVDAELAKLRSIHDASVNAHDHLAEARKMLRDLEHEILDAQEENSPYAVAERALEETKTELNRVVHSHSKPHDEEIERSAESQRFYELSSMTSTERQALDADPAYIAAKAEVDRAAKTLRGIRQQIFETDPHYAEAVQLLEDAEKEVSDVNRQATTAGIAALGDKQALRNAQQAAAIAQAIIQQGEARLHALGASAAPGGMPPLTK